MRAAWAVIGVALVLASGCAQKDWIDRTLVTVDVTGVWEGEIESGPVGRRPLKLTLEQRGSKVTGQMTTVGSPFFGPLDGPLDGAVTGDTFRFQDTRGRLKAELQVNADEMTGPMTWQLGSGRITLRRQP